MYKTNKLYWPFLLIIDAIGYLLFFWKRFKPLPKDPKRILVIKVDHLGDMIMASSFFRNLKHNYPRSEIHLLCRSLTKDVAECIPHIDKMHVIDVPWFTRKEHIDIAKYRGWRSRHKKYFDMAFELHTDPRNIVLASAVSRYVVGYPIRSFGFMLNESIEWKEQTRHTVERNLDLLRGIGLKVDDGHLELDVPASYAASAKKKLGTGNISDAIVCHPISGRDEKNKPWYFWNDIDAELKKRYPKSDILYGGSANDKAILSENIIFEKRIRNIADKLSKKEYLALLQHARLAVTTDTFVSHARAAFDKDVWVADYPGFDHRIWGPFGMKRGKVRYLR